MLWLMGLGMGSIPIVVILFICLFTFVLLCVLNILVINTNVVRKDEKMNKIEFETKKSNVVVKSILNTTWTIVANAWSGLAPLARGIA